MKRVDDEKLIEMLEDGIEQKEIAKYFGVSPSYITKRKKQLLGIEEPPTFATLTDPQKKFCLSKAEGKTNLQAVQDAYQVTSPQSAKSLGTTLMKNPAIQTSIAELLDCHGLTKSYRIGKLRQHVDSRDSGISLKALDQTWRLDGSYAPIPVYVDNTREHLQGISERLKDMMSQIKQSVREEVMRELKEKSLLPDNFIDVTEESEKEPVL